MLPTSKITEGDRVTVWPKDKPLSMHAFVTTPCRPFSTLPSRSAPLKRDLWRTQNGSWGAEVRRPGGMGVGVRFVPLRRALWHLLTVRRPEDWAIPVGERDL